MINEKRFAEIEKLCNTNEKGADAAIVRLQKVIRELIEICKTQEHEIKKYKEKLNFIYEP